MDLPSIQNTNQIRDQWLTPAKAKHAPETIRSYLGNVCFLFLQNMKRNQVISYTVYKQKEEQIDIQVKQYAPISL